MNSQNFAGHNIKQLLDNFKIIRMRLEIYIHSRVGKVENQISRNQTIDIPEFSNFLQLTFQLCNRNYVVNAKLSNVASKQNIEQFPKRSKLCLCCAESFTK